MGLFTRKVVVVDATFETLKEIAECGERVGSVELSGVTFGGTPKGDIIGTLNWLMRIARKVKEIVESRQKTGEDGWKVERAVDGDADIECCGQTYHLYYNGGEMDEWICPMCGKEWEVRAIGFELRSKART